VVQKDAEVLFEVPVQEGVEGRLLLKTQTRGQDVVPEEPHAQQFAHGLGGTQQVADGFASGLFCPGVPVQDSPLHPQPKVLGERRCFRLRLNPQVVAVNMVVCNLLLFPLLFTRIL